VAKVNPDDDDGESSTTDDEILVNGSLSSRGKAFVTLFHESVHQILDRAGVDKRVPHYVIDILGEGLAQMFLPYMVLPPQFYPPESDEQT